MSKETGNVIMFPKGMRTYISLVEQGDADYGYGIHPKVYGRRNGETFTNHGKADIKIKPNDARFGDNPLAGSEDEQAAVNGAVNEFAETEITPQLDQIHMAMNKAGLSDLEIRQGVRLTPEGQAKLAGNLGIAPEEVDLYINSLVQKLRDEDSSDTNALLSDYYNGMAEGADAPIWKGRATEGVDLPPWIKKSKNGLRDKKVKIEGVDLPEPIKKSKNGLRDKKIKIESEETQNPFRDGIVESRFSIEPDTLGNVTIRDQNTGKERFLQGSEAFALMAKLDGDDADQDTILAPLMEKNMNVEKTKADDMPFGDEINAEAGSYNFEWTYMDVRGSGTILYSTKNNRPNLKLISVRTDDGEDIIDKISVAEYKNIFRQGKDFIGDA